MKGNAERRAKKILKPLSLRVPKGSNHGIKAPDECVIPPKLTAKTFSRVQDRRQNAGGLFRYGNKAFQDKDDEGNAR